ncbi:hypothetical protein ACROYT_G039184 [Oculina patagonica]
MEDSFCEELLKNESTGSNIEDLYWSYVTNCVLNAFLSYTAIMLNILTIHAMRKTPSLPKPLKTLLVSLAVSDLGVGLLVQPLYIATLGNWSQHNNTNCSTDKALKIAISVFFFPSFFGVMALSVDRFLAIHLHLRYQELVTHKRAVAMVILICRATGKQGFLNSICVMVISVDRFLAIRLHLRYQELVTHKRVVAVVITKWVFSTFLSLMMLWTPTIVSYVVFAIVEVLCLVTTTLLNYKIYLAVLHHKNQIETIQVQQGQAQNNEMTNVARIRKSAISTFYVYLVFMACYLPQICSYVVITISGQSTTVKGLSVYTLTLVFLNSTLNPVIYCWKMRHIRHAIVDILRNIFSLHSETENHRSLR